MITHYSLLVLVFTSVLNSQLTKCSFFFFFFEITTLKVKETKEITNHHEQLEGLYLREWYQTRPVAHNQT